MALFVSSTALAAGNICFYNGKKHDDRYGKPKNFTGEYNCRDMNTDKLVLRELWLEGEKTDATRNTIAGTAAWRKRVLIATGSSTAFGVVIGRG